MKHKTLFASVFFMVILGSCFIGCKDDLSENDKVSAPLFSVDQDTFYDITISTSTTGATIMYTTDGSDPSTSDTAIKGNKLTVDLLSRVKAFAYKEGLADSKTVAFSVPRSNRTINIDYNADGKVEQYSSSEEDPNDKKAIEVYYSGPGTDGKWYNCDDTIAKSVIYTYSAEGILQKKNVYTEKGNDGKWLTTDDKSGYYIKSEYTDSILTREVTCNTNDEITTYTDFKYNTENGSLVSKTEYTLPGADSEWFTEDDIESVLYEFSDNQLTKKTSYDSEKKNYRFC